MLQFSRDFNKVLQFSRDFKKVLQFSRDFNKVLQFSRDFKKVLQFSRDFNKVLQFSRDFNKVLQFSRDFNKVLQFSRDFWVRGAHLRQCHGVAGPLGVALLLRRAQALQHRQRCARQQPVQPVVAAAAEQVGGVTLEARGAGRGGRLQPHLMSWNSKQFETIRNNSKRTCSRRTSSTALSIACRDEKVANREIRVWHLVIDRERLLNDGQIQNPSAQS